MCRNDGKLATLTSFTPPYGVEFLLFAPEPTKLTFRSPAKIRELYDRFAADKKVEDRQALEYAIERGRGSLWLNLTEEEYIKLK
jgi:hypothetical protein